MATGIFRTMTGRASTATQIPEPKLARSLFSDTRLSSVRFIVRIYVGWQ
jgi:hypothetical protein